MLWSWWHYWRELLPQSLPVFSTVMHAVYVPTFLQSGSLLWLESQLSLGPEYVCFEHPCRRRGMYTMSMRPGHSTCE